MYYSKNSGSTLNIPRNYSGNTFRVIDETERDRVQAKEHTTSSINQNNEFFHSKNNEISEKSASICEKSDSQPSSLSSISSLLSGISVEDVLLLGLIFVIHQNNPNDSTLLLLLILLLAK